MISPSLSWGCKRLADEKLAILSLVDARVIGTGGGGGGGRLWVGTGIVGLTTDGGGGGPRLYLFSFAARGGIGGIPLSAVKEGRDCCAS